MTSHIEIAMVCMNDMLNSLPTDTVFYQFIIEKSVLSVKVLGNLVDNKVVLHEPGVTFGPKFTLEGITRQGGVYV